MFGKFAFFLVLAVCALQGEARTVERTPPFEYSIDDILKVIQELVNKIQTIIGQITNDLPAFLKDLQDKIKEIISDLDINGIISKIKDKIESILGTGQNVKECVEAQKGAIEQLAKDAQAGAQACADAAESKVLAIQEQIKKLLDRADEIRQDVIKRVETCFKDNKLDPVGLLNCLKAQVDPIRGELQQIEKEVEKLIADAKQVAQSAAEELKTCMTNVAADVEAKEQVIIADIKKCVENANPTTMVM